jgi:hypothetical protein
MILLKDVITTLNRRCNIWLLVGQTHSHPVTVSRAVDIITQHITEDHVGELAIADMAEDIVVLSGHHKLTFLEEGDSGGTEEGTIMVQEVVGMAEVVIQVVGRITHRDRCWSDGMAGFAVVVKEPLSG